MGEYWSMASDSILGTLGTGRHERRLRPLMVLVLVLALGTGACGSNASAPSGATPETGGTVSALGVGAEGTAGTVVSAERGITTPTPTPRATPTAIPPTATEDTRGVSEATQVRTATIRTPAPSASPKAARGRPPSRSPEPTFVWRRAKPRPQSPVEYLDAEGDYARLPRGDRYQTAYAELWMGIARAWKSADASALPRILYDPLLSQFAREIRTERAGGLGKRVEIETHALFYRRPKGASATLSDPFWVGHCYEDRSVAADLRSGEEYPAKGAGYRPYVTVDKTIFLQVGRRLKAAVRFSEQVLLEDEGRLDTACTDERVKYDTDRER